MNASVHPVRASGIPSCLAMAAIILLLGGSVALGQGFLPRTYVNRAYRPSEGGPTNSLLFQYFNMSGQRGRNWETRGASSVNTIQDQGAFRMGRRWGRGGGGVSPGQVNSPPRRPLSSRPPMYQGYGMGGGYGDWANSRYRHVGVAGDALRQLGSASQTGLAFGATRQANTNIDATLREWRSVTNRYAIGFSPAEGPSLSGPAAPLSGPPASQPASGTPTDGEPAVPAVPDSRPPATPDGVGQDNLTGRQQPAFTIDDAGARQREAESQQIVERRKGYEAKAKAAFKAGDYRTAANILTLAELVERDNQAERARIRLIMLFAHVASEEYAQAASVLSWLSTPDLVTGQPQGLPAFHDPGEILGLYGSRTDFARQQTAVRMLSLTSSTRYDLVALNAMMAWVAGDMVEARRLASECRAGYRRNLEDSTKKGGQASDLGADPGSGAVEKTFRAMTAWPEHFEWLMNAAAEKALPGRTVTRPAGQ